MRSLKYSIEKYNFKKDSYYGSVIARGESDLREILEDNSQVKDFEQIIDNLDEIIIKRLKEGYSINIADYVILSPVLKGLFESEDDIFDPKRHNIEIIAEPGEKVKKLIKDKKIKVKKVEKLRR